MDLSNGVGGTEAVKSFDDNSQAECGESEFEGSVPSVIPSDTNDDDDAYSRWADDGGNNLGD